jgi:hypothetical protein
MAASTAGGHFAKELAEIDSAWANLARTQERSTVAMPKGRMEIRKGGVGSCVDGRENRRIRLWDFEPKPGTTIAKLEPHALGILDLVDKVPEHRAAAIKSNKFTADGVTAEVRQFVLATAVPRIKRARNAIAKAKQEAAALRNKIKLQPVDKTDVVGFMQRREMRDRMLSMSAEDRGKFLTQNIDRLDPTLALALLELPEVGMAPMMPDSVRTVLVDRALEAQHGPAVAELRELERAIEVAETAVEVGRDELRAEAGIGDPREFDRLAAPFEAKAAGPYLKKIGNDVRVIEFQEGAATGTSRIATPEEIELGTYFRDRAHYDSERMPT